MWILLTFLLIELVFPEKCNKDSFFFGFPIREVKKIPVIKKWVGQYHYWWNPQQHFFSFFKFYIKQTLPFSKNVWINGLKWIKFTFFLLQIKIHFDSSSSSILTKKIVKMWVCVCAILWLIYMHKQVSLLVVVCV